jgi:hypothetical protein
MAQSAPARDDRNFSAFRGKADISQRLRASPPRGALPGAGHMVHMPSHIYYRIGRYFDVLAVNKDAVAADENYLKASDAPMGVYRLGYYPHNVHFILASATMSGDGPAAIAAAEKLAKVIPDDRLEKAPGAQTIKSAIYFARAQFSTPDTILALPDPSGAGPYVSAMWHYARGVAQARQGDLGAAAAESKRNRHTSQDRQL